MAYIKGDAHKIAAMASKSCNAVSARDLYVPLEYSVNVNSTNRTFSVTIVAYCYFGTRININNVFHDMTINGQSVPNYTVNGWVSNEMPGKQIATLTVNGTYNYEGIPSTRNFDVSLFGQMTYFKNVGCTDTKEIPFSNRVTFSIPNIDPYYTQPDTPTITGVTSLNDSLLVDVQTTSFGEGGGKYLYVECSKESDFSVIKTSNKIGTLTGTVRISNLQINTNYYIRAVAANNGMSATGVSQQTSTLAASEILNVKPTGSGEAEISVINYVGAMANTVSTKVQYSADNGTTWSDVGTASSAIKFTRQKTGMTVGDTVLFRTVTTTTAGVYVSDTVEFDVSGSLWGYITGIVPQGGTEAKVGFTAGFSGSGTCKATIYYRPYGMEEEWVKAGEVTMSSGQVKNITITGLNPNYAEYEVTLNLQKGSSEYDTNPSRFYTIPVVVSNDTCDSLDYMVQLICQTYNAIKNGNITIYMNDDTKKWCEGADGIPTLAAIMSRINRFMHAVGCALCSMEGFIELLKESETNQVFMGQMGWVDCDNTPTADSIYPVLSDGIHEAIDELIRQVWHYMGDYDYFARNPLELNAQSGTAVGQTAVLGDQVYTWNGSSWASARDIPHENFGVIHINSGRYENQAFYWFVNDWNRLDADTDEIEARLDALESLSSVEAFDSGDYKIALVAETGVYNDTKTLINSSVPTDVQRDTIVIITQPERQDETHLVVYDDGDGNPVP